MISPTRIILTTLHGLKSVVIRKSVEEEHKFIVAVVNDIERKSLYAYWKEENYIFIYLVKRENCMKLH